MTQPCVDNTIANVGDTGFVLQWKEGCKWKTYVYDCKTAQISGITDQPFNFGAITRSKDANGNYCTLHQEITPADPPNLTLQMYELCKKRGLPLAWQLVGKYVRVIVKYGAAGAPGSLTDVGRYTQIVEGRISGTAGGDRSTYNAATTPLNNTVTMRQEKLLTIVPMRFSQINLNAPCISPATYAACHADFAPKPRDGCNVSGCSDGPSDLCNDGTQTFYIGMSCLNAAGSPSNQFVNVTTDGGTTFKQIYLPNAGGASVPTKHPIVRYWNGRLYVLAYENPSVLYSIAVDANGVPAGSWTQHGTLAPAVAGDVPVAMIACGDTLNILIQSAVGSKLWQFSEDSGLDSAPTFTFPDAANVKSIACCANQVFAVGENGYMALSNNYGSSFTTLVPTINGAAVTADLSVAAIASGVLKAAGEGGQVYTSRDNGATWTTYALGGATGSISALAQCGSNAWAINSGDSAPYNSWLGGESLSQWTAQSPRFCDIPTGVSWCNAAMPCSADALLEGNTVLLLGTDASGNAVAYMGRHEIGG